MTSVNIPSELIDILAAPTEEEDIETIESTETVPDKQPIIKYELSPEFLSKMNARSDVVDNAYSIFRDCYKSAVKSVYISDIIDGESIDIHPENILISEPIDPQFMDNQEHFEIFCTQGCTKTLYEYQKNAIRKLRELELRGSHYNSHTKRTIISNGWLLSLPIGSGKSLVFQFLALFYRNVPTHPIIVSRDGSDIPQTNFTELRSYPFYYENCGYFPDQSNGVVVLEDYTQRKCTVILTHLHLLTQMKAYFENDFPKMTKNTRIQYAVNIAQVQDISKLDILVIEATTQNVATLVDWSYAQPFMRVIIDDYTSMSGIDRFRQIRASSTIFVSGSGVNRKESDIPASYYTLKQMPVREISIVGKPEETFEGIFRDTIATMELLGSSCKFSQYKFITDCEEMCRGVFRSNPADVYPILKSEPFLHHYLSLMFIMRNFDRIKKAIWNVEKDLETTNPKTGKPYLDKSRLKYYFEWKEMIKGPQPKQPVQRGTIQPAPVSNNPLYNLLYVNPAVGNTAPTPIISNPICLCCGSDVDRHGGFGMVASCCGGFYCSECSRNCSTHEIINSETHESITDPDNYYCSCCRKKNPHYYFNISKKKDTAVYAINIAKESFDVSPLDGLVEFDYYFYMFKHGFVPKYFRGKPLNINTDIKQKSVDASCFRNKIIPSLDMVLPKDQLCILSLININNALGRMNILPTKNSVIMFYQTPDYMRDRINNLYKQIITENSPATAVSDYQIRTINRRQQRVETRVQPINNCNIVFKNSVGDLIGLHENIVAIILWNTPGAKDLELQILGRIFRINNWNNKLTFYVSASADGYA
jgi:hypothetical protein